METKEIIGNGSYNLPVLLILIVLLCIAFAICYAISKKHNLYTNKKKKNTVYITKYKEKQESM